MTPRPRVVFVVPHDARRSPLPLPPIGVRRESDAALVVRVLLGLFAAASGLGVAYLVAGLLGLWYGGR